MGYIPSSSTQTLYAYLTQKGRYNLLFGNAVASRVTHFSLHDNDIKYDVSSNIINFNYNKLPKGFVPDITGDNDNCIRSVAQAYIVDENSYLIWGGTKTTGTTDPGPGTGGPSPIIPYPIAEFSASTTSGLVPLTVSFTDKSVNMTPDYTPLSYEWDFQNDGTIDSTDKNPTYTYTSAGIYPVSLKVSNFYGININTKTSYINVTAPVLRKMRLEFLFPTNLGAGESASNWIHRQNSQPGQPATFSQTKWSFGSNTSSGGGTKDPKFRIKISVDPSETDTTSPITQAEKDSATFSIKLQQLISFDWVNNVVGGSANSCVLTFNGDSCNYTFTNLLNPFQPSYSFEIKQAWINANYLTFNNNQFVSINSVIPTPLNIEFNFKLESTSPNVIIPTDKNTFSFIGQVQAKRTA
jgi:PKD repeat protein